MSNEKKKLDAKDLEQVAGGETPLWKKLVKEANVHGTAYCITSDCIACESCRPKCPVGAIYMGDSQCIIGPSCIGCGNCTFHCPVAAIMPG